MIPHHVGSVVGTVVAFAIAITLTQLPNEFIQMPIFAFHAIASAIPELTSTENAHACVRLLV